MCSNKISEEITPRRQKFHSYESNLVKWGEKDASLIISFYYADTVTIGDRKFRQIFKMKTSCGMHESIYCFVGNWILTAFVSSIDDCDPMRVW